MSVGSSQSATGVVLVQKLANKAFSMLHEVVAGVFHEVREFKTAGHDLVVNLLHVVCINIDKGVLSSQQLIKNSAKRPQISTEGISLVDKYFRSHVFRSTYEAEGLVLIFQHFFASTHIYKLQIAVSADHDILWFEVSIYDSLGMENLYDVNQKCHIESGLL